MTMTYSTLVADKPTAGSIKYATNYEKIDVEGVLLDAQAWIYDAMRVREMIATTNLAVAVGDSSIALPDGFLDPISVQDITNGVSMVLKTEDRLEEIRTYQSGVLTSGTPAYLSITGTAFELDCRADAAMTIRLLYFRQPDFLSASNETNFLTTRYPHVLRKTVEAFVFSSRNDDANYARCAQQATAMIAKANENNERYRHGTSYEFRGA